MSSPDNVQTEPFDLAATLAALDAAHRKLPVQAIQAARQHREQIIPELIRSIRQATEIVRQGGKVEGQTHFFALFLLAEFRATTALPAIMDAVSLPGEGPFALFGDAIHETLPGVLLALAGEKSVDIALSLARNRELNMYVRWAAVTTLTRAARASLQPREKIMEVFRSVLRAALQTKDDDLVTILVSELADLGPKEAMDEINEAFAAHLVDEMVIGPEDIQRALVLGPEAALRDLRRKPVLLEDTVAELETWASFQEPPPRPAPSAVRPLVPAKPPRAKAPPPQPLRLPPPRQSQPHHKVGRNDPCPCGSGKKFKKCCMTKQA